MHAFGRCPYCGHPYVPVEVHGHVQCSVCGVNVEPCCEGAPLCSEHTAGVDHRREPQHASGRKRSATRA